MDLLSSQNGDEDSRPLEFNKIEFTCYQVSLYTTDGEDDLYADIQTAAALGFAGP